MVTAGVATRALVSGERTPTLRSADVVIAGGGPAGIGAALGAARVGAKPLLLERHGFCGGVGAWSLGMTINQMRPDGRARSHIHELLIERLLSYGPDAVRIADHALVCNVEYLKVAIFDVLDAAGVRYLLHSRVADSIVENGRVRGVVAATKQGLVKLPAKAVVDATGDADVAYYAGAEMMGREGDGYLAPMTLNIIVANVDVPAALKLLERGGTRRLLEKARGKYPLLPAGMIPTPFPLKNCLTINHTGTRLRGVLDASKPEEFTEAERYSRRQAIEIVQALREFGGAPFAGAQLAGTGPQVGVRESRRIRGAYVLTESDAKAGKRFADAIAWRSGKIDVGGGGTDYDMKIHHVPFRAILPAKLDGLLVGGRCISATHIGAAAGKSMGNCMATGQAAGVTAALSAAKGCMPREVDVRELQRMLAAQGVDLDRT